MRRQHQLAALALFVAGQGVASAQATPAPSNTKLVEGTVIVPEAMQDTDLFNHHADLTSPINTGNAKQMKLAWSIPTKEFVTHTPLVENGRVYFADWGGTVYADDGSIIWQKKVQESTKNWPWHGIAGTGALSCCLRPALRARPGR